MKVPIIKSILLTINSFIIAIILSLLIGPILSCIIKVNYHIGDFIIPIFFIILIAIFYKSKVNQVTTLLLGASSLALAILTMKVLSVEFLTNLVKFSWAFCSNLYPTGENPTLGLFIVSFLFTIWFLIGFLIYKIFIHQKKH